MTRPLRWTALRWTGIGLAAVALSFVLVGWWHWRDRPDPASLGIPEATSLPGEGGVTLTWLGVTTLLIDDGETRLLSDGFFSRPGLLEVLLDRPVAPDLAGIEAALSAAGISRVAAVMPVHSHYDHAMDSGEVARRTGAVVVGSESTANAARGAGLAEERIVVLPEGGTRRFGRFEVTWVVSRHWPLTGDGAPPMPGAIEEPLVPPAPVSAWREGGSYSIHVAHPAGSLLIQGSAGYRSGALQGLGADVVVLGIGGLTRSGPEHARRYWREIVETTGARRVLPVHYDDFTRPYGEIRAFPRRLDDLETSLRWLAGFADEAAQPVALERLVFARPVRLF